MDIEISLKSVRLALEDLPRVTPNPSYLKKLETLPPLHPKANKRTITPCIDIEVVGEEYKYKITEYMIQDWTDTLYRGMKSFTTAEVEALPEK